MKKIGIVCAGDTELQPFLPHIEEVKITEHAMLRYYEGTIRRVPVVALYSGVCKVNAASATQILLDRFAAHIVVNAGTAGSMDDTVRLFDTVIAERMAYHDVADDILTDFHPWMPSVYFRADDRLLELAKRYAGQGKHPIHFGLSVTGERFIEHEERDRIRRDGHPLSVDMETASIAHVCYVNRIPFLSVRTVTDTPAEDGIAYFEENCEKASGISAGIVMDLLEPFAQIS